MVRKYANSLFLRKSTLFLASGDFLLSSVNLRKQFEHRSGLTERRFRSKLFDTDGVPERIFFLKSQPTTKNYPACRVEDRYFHDTALRYVLLPLSF